MKLKIKVYLLLDINVAGGAVRVEPSTRQEQPRSKTSKWFISLHSYIMWEVNGIIYKYDEVYTRLMNA